MDSIAGQAAEKGGGRISFSVPIPFQHTRSYARREHKTKGGGLCRRIDDCNPATLPTHLCARTGVHDLDDPVQDGDIELILKVEDRLHVCGFEAAGVQGGRE